MEIDLYPWDAGTDSGITYMVSILDGDFLIMSQFSDRAIENVLLPMVFWMLLLLLLLLLLFCCFVVGGVFFFFFSFVIVFVLFVYLFCRYRD